MRAGFSPADFAEGTSTMRGSMKPLGDVPYAGWCTNTEKAQDWTQQRCPHLRSGFLASRRMTTLPVTKCSSRSLLHSNRLLTIVGGEWPWCRGRAQSLAHQGAQFQLERLGRRSQHVAGFAGPPEAGALPGPGTAASAAHIEAARMTNGRPSPDKVHQAA